MNLSRVCFGGFGVETPALDSLLLAQAHHVVVHGLRGFDSALQSGFRVVQRRGIVGYGGARQRDDVWQLGQARIENVLRQGFGVVLCAQALGVLAACRCSVAADLARGDGHVAAADTGGVWIDGVAEIGAVSLEHHDTALIFGIEAHEHVGADVRGQFGRDVEAVFEADAFFADGAGAGRVEQQIEGARVGDAAHGVLRLRRFDGGGMAVEATVRTGFIGAYPVVQEALQLLRRHAQLDGFAAPEKPFRKRLTVFDFLTLSDVVADEPGEQLDQVVAHGAHGALDMRFLPRGEGSAQPLLDLQRGNEALDVLGHIVGAVVGVDGVRHAPVEDAAAHEAGHAGRRAGARDQVAQPA